MTEDAAASASAESPTSSDAVYRERRARFDSARERVERRWNLVANLRLVAFVLLGIALWQALFAGPMAWWMAVAVALAVVVGLVGHHGRLKVERDRLERLVAVNDAALARLAHRWAESPLPPPTNVPATHPYARDLDILGPASLLHRIGTPATAAGWSLLTEWLLAPASPAEVVARQPAVAELAGLLDLRQDIEAAGPGLDGESADPTSLLRWAEGRGWLGNRRGRWLRAVAWVSPIALVTLAVAQAIGLVPLPFWVVPLMVNTLVAQGFAQRVSEEVAAIAPLHRAISVYRVTIEGVGALSPTSERLISVRDDLADAGPPIRRLERLSARALPVEGLLAFLVQSFTLWDIHLLAALERWQAAHGGNVRGWLGRVAEVEALAALSVLVYDYPDWCFPKIDANADRIEAAALGHPLIPAGEVVRNDVAVGPRGTFLFVTGSNMSGKSTLLRAIGVNVVLAGAGGPVAATSLRLPPVSLWTSMRIEDSLVRGVSFFLAELERLKLIVDAARATDDGVSRCYLLDEILQGTNTAERQISARRVIGMLLERDAIGAVSSHDLALADAKPLRAAAHAVHFAEQFRDGTGDATAPRMTFDYVLRDGIATSTNALALMELIGLGEQRSPKS